MEDETTILDDENQTSPTQEQKKRNTLRIRNLTQEQKALFKDGGMVLTGAFLGSIITKLTSSTPLENVDQEMDEFEPEICIEVEDESLFCDTVSDHMSFSEAFAHARNQAGPGSFFNWKGNSYNTYQKDEWDNMDSSEKEEFANSLLADDNLILQNPEPSSIVENHDEAPMQGPIELESDSRPNPEDPPTRPEVQDEQDTWIDQSATAENDIINDTSPEQVHAAIDLNADGTYDAIVTDTDGDNYADVLSMQNVEGEIVMAAIDTDNDNHIDTVYTDTNQDGKIDDNDAIEEVDMVINMEDAVIIEPAIDITNYEPKEDELPEDMPDLDDDADVEEFI